MFVPVPSSPKSVDQNPPHSKRTLKFHSTLTGYRVNILPKGWVYFLLFLFSPLVSSCLVLSPLLLSSFPSLPFFLCFFLTFFLSLTQKLGLYNLCLHCKQPIWKQYLYVKLPCITMNPIVKEATSHCIIYSITASRNQGILPDESLKGLFVTCLVSLSTQGAVTTDLVISMVCVYFSWFWRLRKW